MIATAWNNGQYSSTGAGYGVKVRMEDRNEYFKKKWRSVLLKLQGEPGYTEANSDKKSFWDPGCGELVQKDIGIWLKKNVRVPWRKGYPP